MQPFGASRRIPPPVADEYLAVAAAQREPRELVLDRDGETFEARAVDLDRVDTIERRRQIAGAGPPIDDRQ